MRHQDTETCCNMAIFILISGLIEKTLYNELTPSIAAPMDKVQLMQEMSNVLTAYLTA